MYTLYAITYTLDDRTFVTNGVPYKKLVSKNSLKNSAQPNRVGKLCHAFL